MSDLNMDVRPGRGARVATEAPADFTWTNVDAEGSQFSRDPSLRDGFTYRAVQRRPQPAHRAPVFAFRGRRA